MAKTTLKNDKKIGMKVLKKVISKGKGGKSKENAKKNKIAASKKA